MKTNRVLDLTPITKAVKSSDGLTSVARPAKLSSKWLAKTKLDNFSLLGSCAATDPISDCTNTSYIYLSYGHYYHMWEWGGVPNSYNMYASFDQYLNNITGVWYEIEVAVSSVGCTAQYNYGWMCVTADSGSPNGVSVSFSSGTIGVSEMCNGVPIETYIDTTGSNVSIVKTGCIVSIKLDVKDNAGTVVGQIEVQVCLC